MEEVSQRSPDLPLQDDGKNLHLALAEVPNSEEAKLAFLSVDLDAEIKSKGDILAVKMNETDGTKIAELLVELDKKNNEISSLNAEKSRDMSRITGLEASLDAKILIIESSEKQFQEELNKKNVEEMGRAIAIKTESDMEINELKADLVKKKAEHDLVAKKVEIQSTEMATLTKKVDSQKIELDNSQKSLMRNKETSEFLSKSLQDQISILLDSKAASDKKLRNDLEVVFKKDKSEFEEKAKKEKGELEEKIKKEKAEFDGKLKAAKLENEEKSKKDRLESDDKVKKDCEEKIKKSMIDQELRSTKEKVAAEDVFKKEKVKLIAEADKLRKDAEQMKKDIDAVKKELDLSKKDIETMKKREKTWESDINLSKQELVKSTEAFNVKIVDMTKEFEIMENDKAQLKLMKDEMIVLQAKCDLILQENEVAQANYERNLKGVTEKDEALKKMKASKDDLMVSEKQFKASAVRLEREKESIASEILALKDQLEARDLATLRLKVEADESMAKFTAKLKDTETELSLLKAEKEQMSRKIAEVDYETSLSGRKAAQLVKDLQKQLVKQRKGEEQSESSSRHGDDHLALTQENEALVKRAAMFEEELKAADSQLKRARVELEQKSKVVQQYILRDHEAELQPEDKPRIKIGINILSSSLAMQKLDPIILSSINMKMQKLLEDLTIKNMMMDEKLKQRDAESNKIN